MQNVHQQRKKYKVFSLRKQYRVAIEIFMFVEPHVNVGSGSLRVYAIMPSYLLMHYSYCCSFSRNTVF